ncbi:transcription factor GTE4-like isoform X2 [Gastrolobium bilobum]|uniref:transcription factor GTE4-like isoform X2 n=1 Tax=Gastrolobium bilobum TaxID=150636 RepID=UPI002AB2B956|nr:transcription factor GTE4-like isoform X2 [Gastrolobium bilobum]
MASGSIAGGDDGAREKKRYKESKVYTRRAKKTPNVGNTVAPVTTTTKNDDSTATVKNTNTYEAKSNSNDVLAHLPAPPVVQEDENLAQPQVSSILEDTDSAQPQVSTILEDGNSAQPQVSPILEDGNSAQPQVSPILEDGDSVQQQASSILEGRNSPQPQVSPILEDGDSVQQQASSILEGRNSPQPHVSSGLEDGNSPQPQVNSGFEDGNSPQPQVSPILEDGDLAQQQVSPILEDGNLAQPQVSSRLEDVNLVQPQVSSGLDGGNSPQPQVSSRLEGGNPPQLQVSSRLEGGNLPQLQVSSRLEDGNSPQLQVSSRLEDGNSPQAQVNSRLEDGNSPQPHVSSRLEDVNLPQAQVISGLEEGNLPQAQVISRLEDGNLPQLPVLPVSDDSCSHQQDEPSSLNVQKEGDGPSSPSCRQEEVPITRDLPVGNGAVEPQLEDRIKISLASKSKQEMWELRQKLESELDVVRSLVKRIEVKQRQIGVYGNSNVLVGYGVDNGGGAKRAQSEVASAGVPRLTTRPLHQLSLSMLENSQGVSENVEKEKRTPKANQFYHNSEFLLAKDKFPPAESNKKSKLNWKKQGRGEMGHGLGMASKFFKSCSSLLEKLMKHKHGWVFNAPVDVEGLGLHDYFTIITHPMDLGTVKSRLNKNWYKSPKEFAEDVRLTFRNAMTYNPEGQDVHIMAEQLAKIFEDRWAIIESDYNREMRYGIDFGASPPAPSPLSRKLPSFPPPPLDMRRILDRSESLTQTPKPMSITPSSRTPAPKKPKAKDPHKRDMTYDEKQKLSTNLEGLPPEKLEVIVQIMKRKNLALGQHDDEIEVDIDSVDVETLWELDRFVTNYKKSLSKNRRKAELARARAEALQNAIQKPPAMVEIPKETQIDERNVPPSLPVQEGNQADNGSRSSSSSSSSSDSGSSSSDSDSDSSSASGSDAGSQGT